MEYYYKIIHLNGDISLFSSNNEQAIAMVGIHMTSQGKKMIEVNKEEYEQLENQLD
jgi:hypothetical protein